MARADGVGVARFIRDAAGAGAGGEPDADLVRRFAADADPQAFRALVVRHGPVVWGVCRRLVRNHHDAEDAFQATFLVLARGAGGVRDGGAVGGWLCGVAARVAARVRGARRPQVAEVEPPTGHPDGPLGDLTVREAEAVLYEELARLPEKYRAALVACGLEGLSRDEAAARLGWSANRVKHGLERGRDLLRARLARRGVALGLPLLTTLLAPATVAAVPPHAAETAVRYATGEPPPAAVSSLAHGVTRAMWIAKWKWAAACAALMVAAGGTLAAALLESPVPPAAPATAAPNLVLAEADPVPEVRVVKGKEEPKAPWEVAAAFLQHVIDGKTADALKLCDQRAVLERQVDEIKGAGLKRVKFSMILINDSRVAVVTEKAKVAVKAGEEPIEGHLVITLEREKPDAAWLVRDMDFNDEKRLTARIDRYLDGRFNFKPPVKEEPKPAAKSKAPSPAVDVATEFLTHALAEKTDDALKLVVPGTVSENKVGEIKKAGFTGAEFAVILVNDARVEVATRQRVALKSADSAEAHLVLMVTKSKDGAWRVKDIDARNQDDLRPRVELYLAGKYDDKPEKK